MNMKKFLYIIFVTNYACGATTATEQSKSADPIMAAFDRVERSIQRAHETALVAQSSLTALQEKERAFAAQQARDITHLEEQTNSLYDAHIATLNAQRKEMLAKLAARKAALAQSYEKTTQTIATTNAQTQSQTPLVTPVDLAVLRTKYAILIAHKSSDKEVESALTEIDQAHTTAIAQGNKEITTALENLAASIIIHYNIKPGGRFLTFKTWRNNKKKQEQAKARENNENNIN